VAYASNIRFRVVLLEGTSLAAAINEATKYVEQIAVDASTITAKRCRVAMPAGVAASSWGSQFRNTLAWCFQTCFGDEVCFTLSAAVVRLVGSSNLLSNAEPRTVSWDCSLQVQSFDDAVVSVLVQDATATVSYLTGGLPFRLLSSSALPINAASIVVPTLPTPTRKIPTLVPKQPVKPSQPLAADPFASSKPAADPSSSSKAVSDPFSPKKGPPATDPFAPNNAVAGDPFAPNKTSADPFAVSNATSDPFSINKIPGDPFTPNKAAAADPFAVNKGSSDLFAPNKAAAADPFASAGDPFASNKAAADPFAVNKVAAADPFAPIKAADPFAPIKAADSFAPIAAVASDPFASIQAAPPVAKAKHDDILGMFADYQPRAPVVAPAPLYDVFSALSAAPLKVASGIVGSASASGVPPMKAAHLDMKPEPTGGLSAIVVDSVDKNENTGADRCAAYDEDRRLVWQHG
jgi:hypothetical protein